MSDDPPKVCPHDMFPNYCCFCLKARAEAAEKMLDILRTVVTDYRAEAETTIGLLRIRLFRHAPNVDRSIDRYAAADNALMRIMLGEEGFAAFERLQLRETSGEAVLPRKRTPEENRRIAEFAKGLPDPDEGENPCATCKGAGFVCDASTFKIIPGPGCREAACAANRRPCACASKTSGEAGGRG